MTCLKLLVPVALLLVFVVLFSALKSFQSAVLILVNLPFALVGGIFALAISGENVSIPSSIGFIALFGIALTNGLILISRFEYLKQEVLAIKDAVIEGSLSRLRPVFMTAVTTALGLLPLILTTGIGSEIQKPLAIVVVGGLFSSTLLTLVVLPSLYWQINRPKEVVTP
ncbi:MAG: hypothetical protein DRP45_12190 [Candidatus Zixiibacteriota bacterium]|nr:MAG: hypothetical protein DRP45_12190 [candidate division Zixibacteria bacterium]